MSRAITWTLTLAVALVAALHCSIAKASALDEVSISSDDSFGRANWILNHTAPPAGKDPASILAMVKYAQSKNDNSACISRARAARPKAKSLDAWLAVVEVECATALSASPQNADTLARTLEWIQKNPSWLLTGPQAPRLRTSTAKGYLALLTEDIRSNRSRGWSSVDRAEELSPFMDEKTRGLLWRLAGELAFIQQKPQASHDFLKRSLAEVDSEDARVRLAIVDAALSGLEKRDPLLKKSEPQPEAKSATIEATPQEIDLVARVTSSLKGGDLAAAVEDAMKIIRDYPGGTRAKWATDRALEAYLTVAEKADTQFQPLREQLLKSLEKADADRLTDWSRTFFNRGFYDESLTLARQALENMDGARRERALAAALDAAIATEKFDIALGIAHELVEKHAGTPGAREALFHSGLIYYRNGDFSQSTSNFERLIMMPQTENLEVSSRYWMWRSLQKMKSDRADQAADELLKKYPFSYYGLRARLERNEGVLAWKPEREKVSSRLWLTGPERVAWEKAQLLLKAGWLDEAQAEIQELPPPLKANDKAIRALMWAAATGFVKASRLANDAWDERSELRRPPFTTAAFPHVFDEAIATQADARKLDRDLVRGLIKQESSYNMKAVSSSNALGLMQLIPPTARDVAGELKLGNLDLPNDMFDPRRNIEMGTYYLAKMLDHYSGSVPLALASYNAGPARMDRWLKARPSLKSLPTQRSSAPDNEIWIDEIPYGETNFYVKAILRNVLLYKLLDLGRVEISDPLWAQPSSAPAHVTQ